ncbi:hypothetical protein Tco_0940322 [Tanacetum coccineum]|uniref:Uncharacterized protein n=1 Tax=Tanacetum coccineum TaxID=301880 RepID=A0ABQ5DQ08_9ASTR
MDLVGATSLRAEVKLVQKSKHGSKYGHGMASLSRKLLTHSHASPETLVCTPVTSDRSRSIAYATSHDQTIPNVGISPRQSSCQKSTSGELDRDVIHRSVSYVEIHSLHPNFEPFWLVQQRPPSFEIRSVTPCHPLPELGIGVSGGGRIFHGIIEKKTMSLIVNKVTFKDCSKVISLNKVPYINNCNGGGGEREGGGMVSI